MGNDSSQELGSRKSGGPSSSSFRGMEPHNSRHFRVWLSAGAPNTIQLQASAGPSNREMGGSGTEGSITGDESSDSDTVEGYQIVSQEWPMGHPDGYQIGVLPCSDALQTQVFPAFLIQGEGLLVQDSPIWPINSSENIHSMHTANTSLLLQARDNAVPLCR